MSFCSGVIRLSGGISTYCFQTLRYTILSSLTEGHEEKHWHGSTFPGLGEAVWKSDHDDLYMAHAHFWELFGKRTVLLLFSSKFVSGFPYTQQVSVADSEGCGRISVCCLLWRTTVTCSQTSQSFEALAEVHLFTLPTLDSPRRSLGPQWSNSSNCGSGRWTAEFNRDAKSH